MSLLDSGVFEEDACEGLSRLGELSFEDEVPELSLGAFLEAPLFVVFVWCGLVGGGRANGSSSQLQRCSTFLALHSPHGCCLSHFWPELSKHVSWFDDPPTYLSSPSAFHAADSQSSSSPFHFFLGWGHVWSLRHDCYGLSYLWKIFKGFITTRGIK